MSIRSYTTDDSAAGSRSLSALLPAANSPVPGETGDSAGTAPRLFMNVLFPHSLSAQTSNPYFLSTSV